MVYNQCEYLWQKRGVFYFRRRVPNDVQKHYERPYIVISLKTRSKVIFYGQTEPCTTNLKFIRSYKGRRLDQKKHGNLHRLHMVAHEVLEHQSA